MNKHEKKIEHDNFIKIISCRLKGHKISFGEAWTEYTPRQIKKIKRKIKKGKLSTVSFMTCLDCEKTITITGDVTGTNIMYGMRNGNCASNE